MNDNKIKVIFRKFEDQEIIALFPNIREGKNLILSYMEIGQHSAAAADLIRDLTTCSSIETLKGIKMLQNAGYKNLIISKGVKNV